MRPTAFTAIFLFCIHTANLADAEVVTVLFNNASAADELIDSGTEVFRADDATLHGATFDIVVTVSRTADGSDLVDFGGALGQKSQATEEGSDTGAFDRVEEVSEFKIEVDDFRPGTGSLSETDILLSAELLRFKDAGGDDGGAISSLNGSNTNAPDYTWTDIDDASAPGGVDFIGHDPSNNGINLFEANSNVAVTEFRHDFKSGSWTIQSLEIQFDNIAAVPEPSTFVTIATILGLGWLVRRRKRSVSQKL